MPARSVPAWRRVPPWLSLVLLPLVLGLGLQAALPGARMVGLALAIGGPSAVACAGLAAMWLTARHRDEREMADRLDRVADDLALGFAAGLAGGLAFGVAVGLAVGVAFGLVVGLPVGVIIGLGAGLLFGLADGLGHVTGEAVSPVDPITSWRRDRQYVVALVIAFSLVGAVTSGGAWVFTGWLQIGIASGLTGGLLGGLAIGLVLGLSGAFEGRLATALVGRLATGVARTIGFGLTLGLAAGSAGPAASPKEARPPAMRPTRR